MWQAMTRLPTGLDAEDQSHNLLDLRQVMSSAVTDDLR
jgi:hypothetical protein